jgi:hypothetical protein
MVMSLMSFLTTAQKMKETYKVNYVANLLRLKGSSRKLCLLNVNERDEKVKNDSHEFQ